MTRPSSTLLVAIEGKRAEQQPWVDAFRARLPSLTVAHLGDPIDPQDVRYVAAWKAPEGSLVAFTGLHAVFSLGAGVDHLLADRSVPAVPIVRVVDPDLMARMTEWVVLNVLAQHRQTARYADQQRQRVWADDPLQPAAKDVRVGIMGLGVLGADAAAKLQMLGFDVAGWSRTAKDLPNIACFSGDAELSAFLARTQILVVLLPATPATRGILDAAVFKALARDGHLGGPVLLNAGRGSLQNEADILRCLDDGTLRAATLDVFEGEPLEQSSRLWSHPRVTVTPHNAAVSNAAAVADFVASHIEACERGEPLRHVVDRTKDY